MPTVAIAPQPKLQFSQGGLPLNGGLLFTYAAGTTTKLATYTDNTGATPNTNPIVLNANGEADVYLTAGVLYKFTLSPSTDTDPPANAYWTVDNLYCNAVSAVPYADATGTADVITATYVVTSPVLIDGYMLILDIATSNATTTPTFAPTLNGVLQTARTIVKMVGNANVALAVGDLQGKAELLYNLPNLKWILQNPAVANSHVALADLATTATALVQGTQGYTLVAEQQWNSGVAIDFTGIPSWVTKIWIMFRGLNTSGASNPIIQIGPVGGVETTGYVVGFWSAVNTAADAVSTSTNAAGFLMPSGSAATIRDGMFVLTLEKAAAFRWSCLGNLIHTDTPLFSGITGIKACAALVSRVRITTLGGTDTGVAGFITLAYE